MKWYIKLLLKYPLTIVLMLYSNCTKFKHNGGQMNSIKKIAIGFTAAVMAAAGLFNTAGATPGETTVSGFSFPESAIHDPFTDSYFVSNTGNAPGAPAADGFISKLTPSGQVVNYKWADGANAGYDLNDPLGMAVHAGKLYVADIDYVRVFNVFDGSHIASIHLAGVTSLNDVAAYWGGVFVSDPGFNFATNTPTGTDAVYKVNGLTNQVSTVASGTQLANPNGLLYVPTKGLIVNPMTSQTVRVINIGNGQVNNFATLPDVGYDGVAKTGGSLYFNNPITGNVFKTDLNGANAVVIGTYPNFPADINADKTRNRLLIPQLLGGSIIIKQL